jgi:hypothetical protein
MQDRAYKYVEVVPTSGCDGGWGGRGGGGEPGNATTANTELDLPVRLPFRTVSTLTPANGDTAGCRHGVKNSPFPDTVHIPIIHLDCPDAATRSPTRRSPAGRVGTTHMLARSCNSSKKKNRHGLLP